MRRYQLPILLAALASGAPAMATVNTLGSLPATFSWAYFGGALAIGQIHGVSFLTQPGGGLIQTIDVPVWAPVSGPPDGDPVSICTGNVRCEQIGTLEFQYAIWRGIYGHGLTPNRVGAVVFGGFALTDPTDTNGDFTFLQTYHDASAPDGVVDGGTAYGKVNGQIPGWQSNPAWPLGGWNYTGIAAQYQFFDVPFDYSPGSPLETVSFETALAGYDPAAASVTILSDFTWSFSTLGGGLSGQPIAFQPGASSNLLALYGAAFPGTGYSDGVIAPTGAVPEPASWSVMLLGFAAVGGMTRRRRGRRLEEAFSPSPRPRP